MKIFGICNACKKRKFIVKKRSYKHSNLGTITSNNNLCRKCFKAIKKATT